MIYKGTNRPMWSKEVNITDVFYRVMSKEMTDEEVKRASFQTSSKKFKGESLYTGSDNEGRGSLKQFYYEQMLQ